MKIGCVYFIKHKNFTPIKIGYSSNSDPKCRIDTMQTYSPYGSELIGIIVCYNPIQVEKELHKKFDEFRTNGEWFSISIKQALDEIEYYNSINNDSEILKLRDIVNNSYQTNLDNTFFSIYKRFCKIYKSDSDLNIKQLANVLGVSRQTLYRWIDKIEKCNV
jgi:hypothetical protein